MLFVKGRDVDYRWKSEWWCYGDESLVTWCEGAGYENVKWGCKDEIGKVSVLSEMSIY